MIKIKLLERKILIIEEFFIISFYIFIYTYEIEVFKKIDFLKLILCSATYLILLFKRIKFICTNIVLYNFI